MLSLKIVGEWQPEDFIKVLQSVESLYYKAAFTSGAYRDAPFFRPLTVYRPFSDSFEHSLDHQNQALVSQARMLANSDARLFVRRIEYASPGGIDLVGLGRVMESAERIFARLLDFYADRHIREERDKQAKLDTEKKRESLRSLQMENAREFLELRREYGDEIDDQLLLMTIRDQDALAGLIAERKLIGVKRDSGDSDLPEGFGEW